MGEGLGHLDVLLQESVHEGKHDGTQSKPEKPRVIAAFVVAEPFRQVADMMRQRAPNLSDKKDTEENQNDADDDVGRLFHRNSIRFCLDVVVNF